MNRWRSAVLSAGFSMIFGLSMGMISFAAAYSWSTEAENLITTGNVSIVIQEHQRDEDGNRIPYQDGRLVLPGQRTDKLVSVINEGNTAWIRAKTEYWSEDGLQGMSDDMLDGINALWVRRGEYFYFTEPVPTGSSVEFFREITVPREWGREAAGGKFCIGITAQAIQAAGFTPDFAQEMPWFGIPIEACTRSGYGTESPPGQSEFAVIFESGSEGFVKTSDDFFQNFGSIQPGETRTGSLQIGSHFEKPLDIHFRTEIPENQPEEAGQLMEQLIFTIRGQEQILYRGPLSARRLQEGIVIAGMLEQDQVRKITYSVYMPKSLGNASGMQQAKVRWIFSAQYHTSSGGSSGGGAAADRAGADAGSVQANKPEIIRIPSEWLTEVSEEFAERMQEVLPFTGDRRRTGLLLAVMTSSGLAVLALASGRLRGAALVLAAAVLCLVRGTWAYQTDTGQIRHAFAPGTNMTAACQQKVQAENTGNTPCFVRLFADFSDPEIKNMSELSADGENYYAAEEYVQNLPDGWVYVTPQEDALLGGFYYYTKELEAGEKTPVLFSSVRSTLEQTGRIPDDEILVYGESVQTRDCSGAAFSGADGWRQAWLEFLERR